MAHREESQDHAVDHLIQSGSKPSSLSELIHCFHGHLPWRTMNELLGAGIQTNLLLQFSLSLAQCVAQTRQMSAEEKKEEREKGKRKEVKKVQESDLRNKKMGEGIFQCYH